MAWRLAKSLITIRNQVNTLAPNRSKVSDGTIGDTAHSNRTSDHNPNASGVVTAIDLTDDPGDGADMSKIAESLRQSKDIRIKYVILKGRYFSPKTNWQWRPYTGINAHKLHMHLSVQGAPSLCDDPRAWPISGSGQQVEEEGELILKKTTSTVKNNAVAKIQRKLGLNDDGLFGPTTEAAVKTYQANANLEQTGMVDGLTAAFILDKDE